MENNFTKQGRVFLFVLLFVLLGLIARLWQLQIIDKKLYSRISAENAARTIRVIAPRGIIYDKFGNVIVSNRPMLSVYLFPKAVGGDVLSGTLDRLSEILNIPKDKMLAKISAQKDRPFEPVLLKDNLSLKTVIKLEEEKMRLPGIAVNARPVRYYPYGNLGIHLLGYVGEITKEELDQSEGFGYRLGDFVGKDGVEKVYDEYLRGTDGGQQVEVDVYGKPIRTLGSLDPIPGKDVRLTVDLDLQKVVERALGNNEGAVVVLDAASGEVLALASHPAYDPDIFAGPLDPKEWERIDKKGHPFMNRAISVYPPGSIFKPVTLSAALEKNLAELKEVIKCTGSFELGDRVAKCWMDEKGHGEMNILEGLVWSCDVVFYELGVRAGIENLNKYSREYGFGEKTGIDLPGEKNGFIPTASWKKKTLGEVWVKGDSINMAIGQGFVQVTPLQMANMYAAIATGKRFKPHLMKRVLSRDGEILYEYEPEKTGEVPVSEENLKLIRAALRSVVKRGTGVASKVQGIPAGGKTGTAENPGKPHAWFLSYAPFDNPEIIIASFVAHGEHGDKISAYISRDILNWYRKYRLKEEIAEKDFNWKQYMLHGPYRGWL